MQTQIANAKLTLRLRVTGKRPDGFHDLEAEMVTIDLADRLMFDQGDGLDVQGAERYSSMQEFAHLVDNPKQNLVGQALGALGRQAFITIEKHIPIGGGLGGASADAAAVLRWAGVDDLEVAASIGSDVPFCIRGGRANVAGLGEVVQPLEFEDRVFTLLTPPFGVSTAAVYQAWDEGGRAASIGSGANELEPAALNVDPRLKVWKDRLAEATGISPVLAGSGSTWFVEGAFPDIDPGDGTLYVARTARPIG